MKTFCTREKYEQITNGLAKKIGLMILGGIIGAIFGSFVASEGGGGDLSGYMFFIMVFACFPYAWSKIPIKIHGIGFGIVIKFIVALLLGLIITPITFLYDLIRVIVYKVQEKKIADAANQPIANQQAEE